MAAIPPETRIAKVIHICIAFRRFASLHRLCNTTQNTTDSKRIAKATFWIVITVSRGKGHRHSCPETLKGRQPTDQLNPLIVCLRIVPVISRSTEYYYATEYGVAQAVLGMIDHPEKAPHQMTRGG